MRETWFQSLGWEDPLEKEMAAHSSILAWEIPWTEEPGGLQSMESQRVGHDLATEQQQISIKYISCNTFLSPPHNELSKSESEVAQLCPTLCDPMDWGSLPGFSVHGIFQARVLEWAAISFSRGSSQPRD